VKPFAKKFYASKEWKKCRRTYIISVHGFCEHCGAAGYIVDHVIEITPYNINDPSITLNHGNLQFLCTPCHNKKTFRKNSAVSSGVKFDENGDLVRCKEHDNVQG
jgi:5-methylcytosine-specific restriction enzyme A